jgi:hypothetical protein
MTFYVFWAVILAIGAVLALLDWQWIRRPVFAVLLVAGIGGGLVTMQVSPFNFADGGYSMQGLLVAVGSGVALIGYAVAAAGQFAARYLRRRRPT